MAKKKIQDGPAEPHLRKLGIRLQVSAIQKKKKEIVNPSPS
jgi:hypothetical protein